MSLELGGRIDDDLDPLESELRAAQRHACFDFDDLDDDVSCKPLAENSAVVSAADVPVVEPTSPELVEDCSCQALFLLVSATCSEVAANLRGRYVALRFRTPATVEDGQGDEGINVIHDRDVNFVFRIRTGLESRSCKRRRVYVRSGTTPGAGEQHDLGPPRIFLAWGAHGDKWNFLSVDDKKWLAEADTLEGPWVVNTAIAEESERGMRVVPEAHSFDGQHPMAQALSCGSSNGGSFVARVICVPERLDMATKIREGLRRICKDGPVLLSDAQTFPAWDSRGLSADELFEFGFVSEGRWAEGHRLLGCALSHSELWAALLQDASLGGTVGAMMVLEDDAVLNTARPFALILDEILRNIQDYDFVLLGARAEDDWDDHCKHNRPPVWLSEHLVRIRFFMGFWGYLITPRGARRALRTLWGTTLDPTPLRGDCDVLVASACLFGELDIAICIPNLVLHTPVNGNAGDRMMNDFVDYEYRVNVPEDNLTLGTVGCSARRRDGALSGFLHREVPADEIEKSLTRFRTLADSVCCSP